MKITKSIAWMVALILLLALAGCSSSSETGSSQTEGNDSQSQEENNNEEAPSSDETFTFTLATAYQPAKHEYEPVHIGLEVFAERIKERTDGRVQLNIFYSNQLAPQDELMNALAAGSVDFAFTAPQYYGDTIPTSFFTNIPFWSQGEDHGLSLIRDTEIGEIYEREVEAYGAKVLLYGATGEYGIISKKPIRTLEDMNGLAFRAAGGLWAPWYDEMGTSPVNIAAAEIYEALQRGTIDGIPFPYHTLDAYNYHEVADYITYPAILDPAWMATYVSNKTWEKLPSDLQEIIIEVSLEIEQEIIAGSKRLTEETMKIAEETGVEVIHLSDEEYERFFESAQVVWDNFADVNEDTARIIEIMREKRQ
ncbi:TRAP transporter substrate-binding protein [Alkalihalobacterium alkalinitrilicum]|uniref:TRAP transporter substrate-binding protein n=1 Tax=Alkalihalobacterium alkalinitrilicum TaxID=427920 RepID=UPI000994B029|nr:TRAP transporter substrate-binding protein [Alkalihalobacterium alkalinitrilicum]